MKRKIPPAFVQARNRHLYRPGRWLLWTICCCLLQALPAKGRQAGFPDASRLLEKHRQRKDSLVRLYNTQAPAYHRQGKPRELAAALEHYGALFTRYGLYAEALPCLWELLPLSAVTGMTRTEGEACRMLSEIHLFFGHQDSAMHYALKGVELGVKCDNDSLIIACYHNMGPVYIQHREFDAAMALYDKALELCRRVPQHTGLYIRSLTKKGLVYSWKRQPAEAVALHRKAIGLAEAGHHNKLLVMSYLNLASNYLELQQAARSIPALQQSEQALLRSDPGLPTIIEHNAITGMIYWELRQPEKSLYYLQKSLDLSSEMNAYYLMQRTYDTLASLQHAMGNYAAAFGSLKLAHRYRDSVNNEKAMARLRELEIKYNMAEQRKALAEKDAQLQQKNKWAGLSIGGAVLAIMLLLFVYLLHRHRQKLHHQQYLVLRQEQELHLMEAAMQGEERERNRIARDLHDGVAGTLAAVKMYFTAAQREQPQAPPEDYRHAMLLLDEAAREIRKTAHNLLPETLLLYGLNRALELYCQNISYSSRISISYHCIGWCEHLHHSFELSVYRIVQELLHNIIKHARATEAMVQLSCQQTLLLITIEDNGTGFDLRQVHSSIGLSSLQTRVKALNGSLEWQSQPGGGTSVYIEFDVKALRTRQPEAQTT